MEEIEEKQRVDAFCQNVLERQSESRESAFFEYHQGLLNRKHPLKLDIVLVVLPPMFCTNVLQLCHNPVLAGQLGQNGMYHGFHPKYCSAYLATSVAATVGAFHICPMNRVKLRKYFTLLRIFLTKQPPESLAIEMFGP